MKYKLTIIIFFITFFSYSQTIEWKPDFKLQKKDFQGKIPDNTIDHAGTAYNIGYETISNSIWTGRMKIRTYAIFDKSLSWLNEAFYTDDLLNHEQKHFDIAQVFAYKLQNLINKEIKNSEDFSLKFSSLNKLIGDECLSFQEKYDTETDHGTILEVQKKYDKIIEELLKENSNTKD
ncbi:hypothetical protein [Chryseobacterium kwangjuense]|uniref:DUF922 domain-containing protein n=1 Tax=Chryseobacterium kwangjuense TaxID=267125 RepID=A0A135WLL6_9FLAO|nr:hypothetical protein [Chryseobacterium kwangjuense]KXH85804.1 hypothetical protein AU378_08690 [Chryseobacterium kwangjuense]